MANIDAVCGKAIVGQTILAASIVQPTSAELDLGGENPFLLYFGQITPAGMYLSAWEPTVVDFSAPAPDAAGLAFGAVAPTLAYSQSLPAGGAGLALGGEIPFRANRDWLLPEDCTDIYPINVIPITSGPILNTFLCGQRTLGQSHGRALDPPVELDLQPAGCL